MEDNSKKTLEIFRTLFRNTYSGLVILKVRDPKVFDTCEFTFINKSADTVTGAPFTSMLGMTIAETFPTVSETLMGLVFKRAMRTGEPQIITSFRFHDKLVADNYFRLEFVPIGKENIGIFFTNISHQVKALKKLKGK